MTDRRHLLLAGFCFVSLASLASCGPPPQGPNFPDIRFTDEPPIMLQASQIEIRTLPQPTDDSRQFPVPPIRAMQNWALDRLRASGNGPPARFTILDAIAKVKNLPVQGGVSGAFTDQVSQEYDVGVDATIEILNPQGMALRSVHIAASRSSSVLQSASANDRAKARYDLVRALMGDFDRQAEAQLRSNFGLYLLSR